MNTQTASYDIQIYERIAMRRNTIRPSWYDMAEWIANNDNPQEMNVDSIIGTLTVAMAADLTGRTQQEIADRVISHRRIWAQGYGLPVHHIKSGGQT